MDEPTSLLMNEVIMIIKDLIPEVNKTDLGINYLDEGFKDEIDSKPILRDVSVRNPVVPRYCPSSGFNTLVENTWH